MRPLSTLILLASLGLAAYVGVWAWLNIRADYPMEYRENAVLFTAGLMAQGENPYNLEHRPVYANGFGIGYYWATYPAVRLFGNSYQVLRAVSFAFVAGACGLLLWAVRLEKGSWCFALAAALVLFSQLAQGLSIVARPDSLGLFLLLAGLIVPYAFRFRPCSLVFSAALSILGYLTKPYFIVGMPLLFLYLFLFENKLRALVFGFSAVCALGLTVYLIDLRYECYFTETFFAFLNDPNRSWEHMLDNVIRFAIKNLGFLLVLAAPFVPAARRAQGPRPMQVSNWRHWARLRSPLLPARMSFPAFILLGHLLAIVFLLGWNKGNDVLYHYQLLSPFVLWIAFRLADVRFRRWWPTVVALSLNIAWLAAFAPALPRDHTAEWRKVERLIQAHTNVFVAPPFSHFLWRAERTVHDTGHTEGILRAFDGNPTRVREPYRIRTEAFLADIQLQVRNKGFDLIIVCRDLTPLLPPDELKEHYSNLGPISAPMTFDYWIKRHPFEIWVPR